MNTWNLLKEWNKLSLKIVFDNYVQWWILNRLIVVIIPQYIQISKNYVEHLKLIGYMSIYLNNFFNVKKRNYDNRKGIKWFLAYPLSGIFISTWKKWFFLWVYNKWGEKRLLNENKVGFIIISAVLKSPNENYAQGKEGREF